MADTKFTGLTEDTAPGSDSIVPTIDDPGGTPAERKVTLANLAKGFVGGADTQVQYNNGGVFGGDADMVWDDSGKALTIGASTATAQLKLPISQDSVSPTLAFGDGNTGFYEHSDNLLRVSLGGAAKFQFNDNAFEAVSSGGALLKASQSGTVPSLVPDKDDNNTGLGAAGADQLSLIAGALEVVRVDGTVGTKGQVLLPQESLAATPTLAFGDGDTGIFEGVANQLHFATGGGNSEAVLADGWFGANTTGRGAISLNSNASDTVAQFQTRRGSGVAYGLGGATGNVVIVVDSKAGLLVKETSGGSNVLQFDFDAGDNGAEQVGALTSLKSVSATVAGAAAATITATDLIPAGSFVVGITGRVETTFGGAIATMSIGDGSDADRWGTGIVTDGDVTWDLTDATASAGGWFTTATSVVFTGDVAFEASGTLDVIVHYFTLTAATA